MDLGIKPGDYRSISDCLAIVRLQSRLLQDAIETDTLDEATLVARLHAINCQTVQINALLDAIQGVSGCEQRPDSPRH